MRSIRQISYWKLRLFCEAYICQSYTQAGENMNISQTSITKAIDDIEYLVGNSLFFKQNNAIQPTKYADDLFRKIQPLLREMEKTLISKNEISKHNISIAASHSACTTVLPVTLAHPSLKDAEVNIHNTDRSNAIALLRRDVVNIAMFPATEIPNDCKILAQLEFDPAILVHKDNPIVNKKNITKEDVFRENLIMIDDYKISQNYRELFTTIYERQRIKISNADYEMISRFVARGHGSCLYSDVPIDIKNVVCINLRGILPPILHWAFAMKTFEPSTFENILIDELRKVVLNSTSFAI